MGTERPRAAPYYNRSVAFYMYDGDDLDELATYSACLDSLETNKSVDSSIAFLRPGRVLDSYVHFKHSSELHFVLQLQRSKWRVRDPSKARLFVVPLLHGFQVRPSYSACTREYDNAWKAIQNTPTYKRFEGADHVLHATDFLAQSKLSQMCRKCIWMRKFRNSADGAGCLVLTPMVGSLHKNTAHTSGMDFRAVQDEDAKSFAARANTFYFAGSFDGRPTYETRRRLNDFFNNNDNNLKTNASLDADVRNSSKFLHAGYASTKPYEDYVSQMASTRFGLHVSGDNPDSNRVFEWLEVGAVLVIVSDGFYSMANVIQHAPWKTFTVSVREKQSDDGIIESLNAISAMSQAEIESLREQMRPWIPHLSWWEADSVVAETLLLDAYEKCYLNVYKRLALGKEKVEVTSGRTRVGLSAADFRESLRLFKHKVPESLVQEFFAKTNHTQHSGLTPLDFENGLSTGDQRREGENDVRRLKGYM